MNRWKSLIKSTSGEDSDGHDDQFNRFVNGVCAALLVPLLEWWDERVEGVEEEGMGMLLNGCGVVSRTAGSFVRARPCCGLVLVSQDLCGSGRCLCCGGAK